MPGSQLSRHVCVWPIGTNSWTASSATVAAIRAAVRGIARWSRPARTHVTVTRKRKAVNSPVLLSLTIHKHQHKSANCGPAWSLKGFCTSHPALTKDECPSRIINMVVSLPKKPSWRVLISPVSQLTNTWSLGKARAVDSLCL